MLDLDQFLVCPVSKQPMDKTGPDYFAPCGFIYPDGDFRVNVDFTDLWSAGQEFYEQYVRQWRHENETIPGRIESVDATFRDVYAEIKLEGLVLDVAGDIGTVVTQAGIDPGNYVSIETMRVDFKAIERDYPQYAEHYGRSRDACFVQANAEFLPVKDLFFDCVHMRGCLDHFAAPHIAIAEAYRVLKPGGSLVLGLALEGAYQREVGDLGGSKVPPVLRDAYKASVTKLKQYPMLFTPIYRAKARIKGIEDRHIFHPTYPNLINLVRDGGFEVEKEVWQKAYHNVLYISARKADRADFGSSGRRATASHI